MWPLIDTSLGHLATHCGESLHTLHLSSCDDDYDGPAFSGEAINSLLQLCPKLHTLYIDNWCEDPDFDTGIVFPPALLNNLATLVLRGNVVREHALSAISKHGRNLQVFAIDDTCNSSLLQSILHNCSKLKEVYVNLDGFIIRYIFVLSMKYMNE